MRSIEQLLTDSRDPRLEKVPLWVQRLVIELAVRLKQEAAGAERVTERAEREVEAARKLLNEGPEDSDTFMSLSGVMGSNYSEDGREDERPLGTGTRIEFRKPGEMPGEGFSVHLKDGALEVSGINTLAIHPADSLSFTVSRG